MRDETKTNIRVGILTVVALAVLGVTIMSVGKRQQLFTRHTRYHTDFRNVTGLQIGAPVQLNGVTVGFVERIDLPTEPEDQRVTVRFTVNEIYTERIRLDTRASITTTGLLGDKFLEIRGGSSHLERIYEGSLVPGKDAAEVAEFVSSGEDLMQNLLEISSSLKLILRRVEAGEGLLGELTTSPDTGHSIGESLQSTLVSIETIAKRIENGEGLVGRLLAEDQTPPQLMENLSATFEHLRSIADTMTDDLERDDTVYASLLRNPDSARLFEESLSAIKDAGEALAAAVEELSSGNGTLPRLMKDEDYADDFLEDLGELATNLRTLAEKINEGTGTAGAFVNDPQLYEDIESVVRGVKNSKITSWFIRNKRAKGEKIAEEEAAAAASSE